MTNAAPSIMVSSTFYDLRQIRADLANFFTNDLGYRPLLSELSSFPIDPDSDTVSNCRKRVEDNCDIMVLIVGGRYGYIDTNSAKSITNLEYLTARSKGIPIYTFVQKNVLATLPVWKNNKNADFHSVVDDTRIFDFIETIRSIDKVWMFEFETAQNIIETLRAQFAHIMAEGLSWRLKFRTNLIPKDPNLSGESIKIILEKPKFWEYTLFAQSLVDQIAALDDYRREYQLGLVLGTRESVTPENFSAWFHARTDELLLVIEALTKIAPGAIEQSFGPPGKPGDVHAIVFVTRKLASIYTEAIQWSQRIQRASFHEILAPAQTQMAEFSKTIIDQIEALGSNVKKQLEQILAMPEPREPQVITIKISVDIPNADKFNETLRTITSAIRNYQS